MFKPLLQAGPVLGVFFVLFFFFLISPERNINVRRKHLSVAPLMGLTGERTHNPLVHGTTFQLTEPSGQGVCWQLSYALAFKVKKEPWRGRKGDITLNTQHANCLLEFTALLQVKGHNLKLENNLSYSSPL